MKSLSSSEFEVPISSQVGQALDRLREGDLFYLRYPRGELQECRVKKAQATAFIIAGDAKGPIADAPVLDILFDRYGQVVGFRVGE